MSVDSVRPAATDAIQSTPRLLVTNLAIQLDGGVEVVSEVSFSVGAGRVLGLVGESGSGKTTVALALLGHVRRGASLTSGTVVLDDENLFALSRSQLAATRGARIAYVPQDPGSALNPAMRVGDQLRETLEAHPGSVKSSTDISDRITAVLKQVRLDSIRDVGKRYPHQLSGGQQQRIAIGMAFICQPRMIVLDEPTTGLDVTTERHLIGTIRDLCSRYHVAAVYVSHDLAIVSHLANEVIVMYSGRIVERGPATSVLRSPAHPYTQGLLRALPSARTAELLEGIDGQPPRLSRRPSGCAFAPRCGWAQPACGETVPSLMSWGAQRAAACLRLDVVNAGQRPRRRLAQTAVTAEHGMALTVASLTAHYGTRRVLTDISLSAAEGECVAIVGESGSGKTTLARCIVGLHRAWTGSIAAHGEKLPPGARSRSRESLRQTQYVFQNPYASLNPRQSVAQLLEQPLRHHFELGTTARWERVLAVLDAVSLGESYTNLYPDQLSGGERQRVAIARALLAEPRSLVCDEVTSALDVSVQATIVEMLRGLQRERFLAMLFITHNLAIVRSISDRVFVLKDGVVVESGRTAAVLDSPSDPYTAQLLADVTTITDGEMPSPAKSESMPQVVADGSLGVD